MNILILGAAGFIGTNLAIKLAEKRCNKITLVDKHLGYFSNIQEFALDNVEIRESFLDENEDFSDLAGQDIVFHLVSTNVPATSNFCICRDIEDNVSFSLRLFDACVKYGVKTVVFISSGGTVYGKEVECPVSEDAPTNPISSYGVQKVTIEKLLYLYNHVYDLDYRIVRLANPYGPYQRPNGILGVITTFVYKTLKNEEIQVYGDGSVIRDFIYIDDAVNATINIVNGKSRHRIFNVGCGYGTSIRDVLATIEKVLHHKAKVVFREARAVDVPVNYLDISRYEKCYGSLNPISLEEGVKKTAEFIKQELLRV